MALGFNPTNRTRAVGFDVKLEGLSALTRKLENRIRRMEQDILRKALTAFAEPIRAAAERNARAAISPTVSIAVEIKMRGSSGTVKIGPLVNPGKKFTGPFRDAFWLFFFEYGYWIRKTRKGPAISFVSARPTMRPAYDAHKEEGLRAMEKILLDALSEEVPQAA